MPADKKLSVVFLWHMHQPDYRDPETGRFWHPWTYLHAIKDYCDMAAHLEEGPKAHAVVNFAPVLLEQIEAYAEMLRAYRQDGGSFGDPFLAALAAPEAVPTQDRLPVIKACLRAHEDRLIARFAPYAALAEVARTATADTVAYLSDQFLSDILVWWHLAWLGETVRRDEVRARSLIEKQRLYTAADRQILLELIGDLLSQLIPRYRALAESGRIELSFSPYAHPILPLLIDFQVAREAMPDAELPEGSYPGGLDRARWHIRKGRDVFERAFGLSPQGCWPSEGALSQASLDLLAGEGLRWAASGGQMLHNSFSRAGQKAPPSCAHRGYRPGGTGIASFFRDDGLSDLIGFTYSSWHADDAVADLIGHLERIAEACRHEERPLVAIIMDGENPWEHYPDNGLHFLQALYARFGEHAGLEMTTFSRWLATNPSLASSPALAAGSWVYGTLSTWIGERSKNRAWELLRDAKRVVDQKLSDPALGVQARFEIEQALAVCEGSDWFWWLGDYNPKQTVAEFEALYRRNLEALYRRLGAAPPAELGEPLSEGNGAPALGGVMRSSGGAV